MYYGYERTPQEFFESLSWGPDLLFGISVFFGVALVRVYVCNIVYVPLIAGIESCLDEKKDTCVFDSI